MTCYDFPDMVIHNPPCEYVRGGTCYPRPSTEAPDDVVRQYVEAMAFRRTGIAPGDAQFVKVPKFKGRSIDPHTGKQIR